MAPDKLIGFAEVVKLLDRPRSTVSRCTNRPDFPAPVKGLAYASGRVWRLAEVVAWAKAHPARPRGRPRKPA